LLLHERADGVLALADQAERHGLDPPGRKARPDGLPQQRAHLVAHEPVEDAPGLLRLDLLRVERAWRGEGTLHGVLRDLPEGDALEAVRLLLVSELLGHVVGDRLALAVGI